MGLQLTTYKIRFNNNNSNRTCDLYYQNVSHLQHRAQLWRWWQPARKCNDNT